MDTNILVEFATFFFFARSMTNICLLVDIEDKVIYRCQMNSEEERSFPTSIQTPVPLREHFLAKDFTFCFISLHFFFIKETFCPGTSCSNRNKKKQCWEFTLLKA